MKLLIITSIKEDLETVSMIMQRAGIAVFSVTEVIGHKTEHHDYLPDNWFGKNHDGTDSLLFFSFTSNEKATNALHLITEHNADKKTDFPARAFVLPVESASM